MESAVIDSEADSLDEIELIPDTQPDRPRSPADLSRRRFTAAVLAGSVIVLPLVIWVMWDLWSGSVDPTRAVLYDNFYDLQASAMLHGHLYLPNGRMGIEAFVHDGRQFTYFGLFPSIIRMPIIIFTDNLDGKLTSLSILLAWTMTALFSSLMLWRLRILARGQALLGRAEAASYGVLMATVMGGSVVLYLGATPFIYSEDFAWSIPLTLGSLFALLGVLERPTRGRVIASGVLVLCANLDRTPTGYACVIAAGLVACWFFFGRGGEENRRWFWPVSAVAIGPFLVSCVVTYAKFGLPVGLPMAQQVWASVNAHRRDFLAANGGKAFSFGFLPSTLWAYLQPFGVRISGIFPFFAPPGAPASWLGGAVLDQTYPTASFTATTPLLFLLSCWGAITAFRPKPIGELRLTRIILLCAAIGAGGVLLWGYISQRYLADFMPFFIIASSIALIDIWRRLEGHSRRVKETALGILVALAAYCVAANLAISAFPVVQWTTAQVDSFVSAQQSLSVSSLASRVTVGNTLPYWAPAGQIYAIKDCTGLYLSTGDDSKNVPGQNLEHYPWLPVEQSPSFSRTIGFTFNRPARTLAQPVTLMTYGSSSLVLQPQGLGFIRLVLENSGTSVSWPTPDSWNIPIYYVHERYKVSVTVDPYLNSFVATWYGSTLINHYVAGNGPIVVKPTPKRTPGSGNVPVVTVSKVSVTPPFHPMRLCHSLLDLDQNR